MLAHLVGVRIMPTTTVLTSLYVIVAGAPRSEKEPGSLYVRAVFEGPDLRSISFGIRIANGSDSRPDTLPFHGATDW